MTQYVVDLTHQNTRCSHVNKFMRNKKRPLGGASHFSILLLNDPGFRWILAMYWDPPDPPNGAFLGFL